MSFFLFILVLSAIAYVPQFLGSHRSDYRMALRHGMAGGFIFTGFDHFLNAQGRYVPMMPDFLADHALELVYSTGAAELVGAVGLSMMPIEATAPTSGFSLLSLPSACNIGRNCIALSGGSVGRHYNFPLQSH